MEWGFLFIGRIEGNQKFDSIHRSHSPVGSLFFWFLGFSSSPLYHVESPRPPRNEVSFTSRPVFIVPLHLLLSHVPVKR